MSRAVLPSPGTEFEMRCRTSRAAITVRAKSMFVEFTGYCAVRVEAGSDESERLRVLDLSLVAELPDAGGPEDGGTITLARNESTDQDSILLLSPDARLRNHLVIDLTAAIDQPGGAVELVAKNPAQLTGVLTSFPPNGDDHHLAEQVDFVLADSPAATLLQISELVLRLDAV
jgi:hypothetical protein